jgi:hypothetical protein
MRVTRRTRPSAAPDEWASGAEEFGTCDGEGCECGCCECCGRYGCGCGVMIVNAFEVGEIRRGTLAPRDWLLRRRRDGPRDDNGPSRRVREGPFIAT